MDTLLKLGIDWQSIIFYLINFGILFFVIAKFLLPPMFKTLDKRKHTIENSIVESERLKKEFEKQTEEMQREKEEASRAMAIEMENLKTALEKKKTEMYAEIDAERERMMKEAQKEIDARKAELLREAEAQTLDLIKKVVFHVVQNKIPQEAINDSVKEAWKAYTK